MGAVSLDIYKQEREFERLTLSDENVVKYLILHRSKVDISYGASCNLDINQAGDITGFNQEIIVLYASLDNILEHIKIKEKDRIFLKLVFEGNDISDIIESHNFPRKTAYRTLDRIVNRVINANRDNWQETMIKKGYKK